MTDTAPVTDDDRRNARKWAEQWTDANGMPEKNAAARVILADVPAPPATLADELRAWGACPFDGLNWTRFHDLADRAEAVETENRDTDRVLNEAWAERDEARAEVERLTATFKEPLKEPGHLPDPADVPDGEAWAVNVNGQRRIGIRSDGAGIGYGTAWATSPAPMNRWWVSDEEVTLVSCLVPDTRRVIDRPEALDALPVGSIVRDKTGRPWRSDGHGHWDCGMAVHNAGYVLHFYGPVTVIHEPEVTA